MILPKDLKQAIQTLIKYGGSEDNLKNYVSNLVNKELGIKPKEVSKPTDKPKKVESDKQSESSGDVIFPTTTIEKHKSDYSYLPKEKDKDSEPTEMQKALGAIAQEDINDVTKNMMLHLVPNGKRKYKIWLTCKQLAKLTLGRDDHESQNEMRGEIYKVSKQDVGYVEEKIKDASYRKNVIHYALTDEGSIYMNTVTIGVKNVK